MKVEHKWIIGISISTSVIAIVMAIIGWTRAETARASNAEHQALSSQLDYQSVQIQQEIIDRKEADRVILERLDGTPEKLSAIDAKLQIIMRKLGY
jgi:hypothetical protein